MDKRSSQKSHRPDYALMAVVFSLTAFGLIVLASASVVVSQDLFQENYYFLKHQLVYALPLGLIGFFIAYKISYRRLKKISFPLIVLALILLFLVFVPGLGYGHSGAKRWIIVDSFSFQPFEFLKLALVIYLAGLLSRKSDEQKAVKESLGPFLVVLAVIVIMLVCQPNMSALIITFLIVGLIYFMAGIKMLYLWIAGFLGLIGSFFWIKTNHYQMNRLNVFLHPEMDPQGIGYQINQALLAIGSGGLFGLGIGHSVQKWKYLPEIIGDSIFAIVAEEMGFLGAGILVALFVFFAWRGLMTAWRTQDRFGYLLAGGITGWIFFQAFINIAAISGIIPLTGMPLPFISYGGTALAVALTASGILANISKHQK